MSVSYFKLLSSVMKGLRVITNRNKLPPWTLQTTIHSKKCMSRLNCYSSSSSQCCIFCPTTRKGRLDNLVASLTFEQSDTSSFMVSNSCYPETDTLVMDSITGKIFIEPLTSFVKPFRSRKRLT